MRCSFTTLARSFLPVSTALALGLCGSGATADTVVGIAGPLTGDVASNGEQNDLGAQRAIFDLNQAGGVLGEAVESISVDDACDAGQTVAAAKRLIAAKVDVVFGHLCSRSSIIASELYDAAGILMVSPSSTNPAVPDSGRKNVFRTIGRDNAQAAVASRFILENFGQRRIALLHDGNTYGQGLVEGVKAELNAAGKQEALFAPIKSGQISYVTAIEELVDAEADLVYLVSNSVSDLALFTRQLKDVVPTAVLISADAMASEGFLLIAGEAANGTFFTFSPDARLFSRAADVVASFRDEEAFEPEGTTLSAYAAVQAWTQAVEAAGSRKTPDVIAALRSGTFDTVIGDIGFDEIGDVTGIDNFVMYVWKASGYAQVE
ncbi:MAG: branched-chain amino acid ABC transporter substrate-binding protein [Rhodobacteraceae bacterium]|nr:MAG: branched-chain amino acid ABC transporter substrate-binding protein [Paracoccaceae bacterium]